MKNKPTLDEVGDFITDSLTEAQVLRMGSGSGHIRYNESAQKLEFASGPAVGPNALKLPLSTEICFSTSQPRPLNAKDVITAYNLLKDYDKAAVVMDASHLRQDPTTKEICLVEGNGRKDPHALVLPDVIKIAMLDDRDLINHIVDNLRSTIDLYPEAIEQMLNGIRKDLGQEEVVAADKEKGEYHGKVVEVYRNEVLLKDSRTDKIVRLDRKELSSTPKENAVVSVKYKEGKAQVEAAKTLAAGQLSR